MATPAFADDPVPATTYAPDVTYLTKTVAAADNATHDAMTFTFDIAKVSVNGLDTDTDKAEMPMLGTNGSGKVSITVSAGKGTTKGVAQGTDWIPAISSTTTGNKWLHAGEYIYEITEDGTSPLDNVKYSQAKYELRVYVVNDGTSLSISGITVNQLLTDAKATGSGKVDPTQPEGKTGSDFNFTNTYSTNHQLTIAKTVSSAGGSDVADKTKQFSYTLNLKLPATDMSLVGKTVTFVRSDSTTADPKVYTSTTFAADGTAQVTFSLCAGQDVKLRTEAGDSLLPTGTTYDFTETGVTNYKPTATVHTDTVADDATVTVDTGANLEVGTSKALGSDNTVVGNDEATKSTVDNQYVKVTPTGIIINNLPFILIGVIAIAGFTAYIVSRRRHAQD
jgi:hypothetical protein